MKLLRKFYNWLRPDGVLHLGISALLFLLVAPFAPAPWRIWLPALFVLFVGLAKEFLDATDKAHTAEWHDVACDLIGIACGVFVYLWDTLLHQFIG